MIKNSLFLNQFLKKVKKVLTHIQKIFDSFSNKYPNFTQNIQLTFIYFFALVDLLHSVLNNVFSFDYYPEILQPFFPFIQSILVSPFFQIWASPEKVFFLSYVIIELMIVRSVFKFSKLVKYNILLIFALLMLQSLAVSYWDILFHREISAMVSKWSFDKGLVIYTDKNLAIAFFLNTFFVFVFGYIYFYFRAIQGKFATIPTMEWLTDSIAFWLRIKTPTMRVGSRRKSDEDDIFDDENEDNEDNEDNQEDEDNEEDEEDEK